MRVVSPCLLACVSAAGALSACWGDTDCEASVSCTKANPQGKCVVPEIGQAGKCHCLPSARHTRQHRIGGHSFSRDNHNALCPKEFHNGRFGSPQSTQACCVLDKALGALELVQDVRDCKVFKRDKPAGQHGDIYQYTPCNEEAAMVLKEDLLQCCNIVEHGTCQHDLQPAITFMINILEPSSRACMKMEDNFGDHLLGLCDAAWENGIVFVEKLLAGDKKLYATGIKDLTTVSKSLLHLCDGSEVITADPGTGITLAKGATAKANLRAKADKPKPWCLHQVEDFLKDEKNLLKAGE